MASKILDPRAQSAGDFLRKHPKEYSGAIMPRWLMAALPPRSIKRGWRDAVAIMLLAEIISVHRLGKDGEVYFRRALYQFVRVALAAKF